MVKYNITPVAQVSLDVAPFCIIFGGIENLGVANILGRIQNTNKQEYGLHNAKSLLVIGDTAVR